MAKIAVKITYCFDFQRFLLLTFRPLDANVVRGW